MRASERVYLTLLDEIQRGALAPGRVLNEVEQANRLGVSRTPLREAITRLVADGLVLQRSPRVVMVSAIDVADIRALFELRGALEVAGARIATNRGDRAAFAALAAEFAAASMRAADAAGVEEYYDLIARFDTQLDASLENDYLLAALRNVRTHLVRVRRLARDNPERLRRSVGEHQLIATAIADGDADLAVHATHVHLHNALENILNTLENQPGASQHEGE